VSKDFLLVHNLQLQQERAKSALPSLIAFGYIVSLAVAVDRWAEKSFGTLVVVSIEDR
jgi:siderophore synthetase component